MCVVEISTTHADKDPNVSRRSNRSWVKDSSAVKEEMHEQSKWSA